MTLRKNMGRAYEVYRERGVKSLAKKALRKLADSINDPEGTAGTVPEFWSDYLTWLTFANAGMLVRGNVYCIDYAIKNLPSDAPIVEIGSFCGLSTNVISYCKELHGVKNKLITCDKWIFEGAEKGGMVGGASAVSHPEYRDFVIDSFKRNIQMFSRNDLPYSIEMFSDEFFAAWSASNKCRDIFGREIQLGGPISFCYIDGNHQYDYAKRDFENCDKFLQSGGFILFDDSADSFDFEVYRVVEEVMKGGKYNLLAKNPNYFFKKK